MGLIPRSFLEDLLSQTDIVSFIDSYLPLKKQGANFVACCPFHQEKTPSFSVISKKQFYHCFGCGVSGNAISFAMNYLNQDFSEAVDTLALRAGMQVPRDGKSQEKPVRNLYQLLHQTALFYQKALQINTPALQYLAQRGVTGDVLAQFQIGYAPAGWHTLTQVRAFHTATEDLITTGMLIKKDNGQGTYDRYRHRLMFPIHDRQGRIIGFGGRALDDAQKPKYLNSPETVIFHKNRELYGLHQVLNTHAKPESIIIVEGYMDVIALAQAGITNAVATLGTATSIYHIQLLAKHTPHIIFCFDGDAAGQQAAMRALENMLPALDTTLQASFVFLPNEHDPDSYIRAFGKNAFETFITNATSFHQYFLQILLENIDILTVQGKNQFLHKAKPYLVKIPESPFKLLLLNELAQLTRLDVAKIQAVLEEKTESFSVTPTLIKRTPLRIATALILQHPHLYANLLTSFPPTAFSTGYPVLCKLMESIVENPRIHSAALIENFRNTDWFSALNKLATWDHLVPSETLEKELIDTLSFLIEKQKGLEIDALIQRAKTQSLTINEQQQLQEWLKLKKIKV